MLDTQRAITVLLWCECVQYWSRLSHLWSDTVLARFGQHHNKTVVARAVNEPIVDRRPDARYKNQLSPKAGHYHCML